MEADFSFLVSVHSCVGVTASLIMVVYDQVDTGIIRAYLFPITGKILAMKGSSSNNTSILEKLLSGATFYYWRGEACKVRRVIY